MKTLKFPLASLVAAGTMVFLVSCGSVPFQKPGNGDGCCETRGNLIRDGSFEYGITKSPNNQNAFTNPPTTRIPPNVTDPTWTLSAAPSTVEYVENNGRPNTPILQNPDINKTHLSYPTQLWNTPCGKQFMAIGFNLPGSWIADHVSPVGMALSQDGIMLVEKRTYRLTFFQSSVNAAVGGRDGTGRVRVELMREGETASVLHETQPFVTPPLSPWIRQTAAPFTIPAGKGGKYTVKFSAVENTSAEFPDKTTPAFIDDVSLREE